MEIMERRKEAIFGPPPEILMFLDILDYIRCFDTFLLFWVNWTCLDIFCHFMIILDHGWSSSIMDDHHRSWMIIDHTSWSIMDHEYIYVEYIHNIIHTNIYKYLQVFILSICSLFQFLIKPSYFHPRELILWLPTTVWRVDIGNTVYIRIYIMM